MLRIKHLRLPALLLASALVFGLLLPVGVRGEDFRPDNEDLYFAALEQTFTNAVETAEVYRGNFYVKGAVKAQVSYANVSYVSNQISKGEVTVVQYLVSNGSYVNSGDPLVQVRITADEVKVTDLEKRLKTAEENLESYIATTKGLLNGYLKDAEGAASSNDRYLAQLMYDRLKVTFDEEVASRESTIEDLLSQLDFYEDIEEFQYIRANASGYVGGLNRLRTGERINYYGYVCAIYDTSEIDFYVRGGSELLSYNMPVTIVASVGQNTVEIPGHVVSCRNAALPSNLVGSNDYIEADVNPSVIGITDEVTIRFNSASMENVLIVPKEAVYSDNKGSFVYFDIDGMSTKRYIITAGESNTEVWVLAGLSEGDRVVVK